MGRAEKYEIKKKSVGGVALRRFPFFLLLSFALLSLCCRCLLFGCSGFLVVGSVLVSSSDHKAA